MLNRLFPAALIAATTLLLPLAASAQTTTFSGNGATGFGGEVGKGSLTVSEMANGAITFGLALGNGKTSQDGNVSIFYIDSVAGGFQNTSTLHDSGTNADGVGITGGNGSAVANFASGFGADYAVAFQDGYLDLFKLNTDGTISYINGNSNPSGANAYQLTFNASDIGTTATSPFSLVGTLISGNAYRSNEAIGNIGTVSNPGFNSSITYSNFDTFTPPAAAPEPSGLVSLLVGMAVLGGLTAARRRTATLS